GVVAANGHQAPDAELLQGVRDGLEVGLVARWIGARGAQDGAALEVDAAHVLDVERLDVTGVAAHQQAEAFVDAEHLGAAQDGADSTRADHAVDAGCGPASNEDRQPRRLSHASSFPPGWAEGEGFEPSRDFNSPNPLSRRAH